MAFNVPTIFNASDKGAGVTLSNGSLTAVNTASGQVRSLTKVSSGKWYVEFTRVTSTTYMLGLASSSAVLTQYPGQSNLSIGLYQGTIYVNGVSVETVAALNVTGVFGMAVDADARTVRFFNAGGTTTSRAIPFSGDIYLAAGADTLISGSITLNAGASAFSYSVPSGFTSGYALRAAYGIGGNIDDASGANAARTVRGYNRSTGALTCSTVSNGTTGDYVLIPEPNTTDSHVVIALPVSTSENALVLDRMVPA